MLAALAFHFLSRFFYLLSQQFVWVKLYIKMSMLNFYELNKFDVPLRKVRLKR